MQQGRYAQRRGRERVGVRIGAPSRKRTARQSFARIRPAPPLTAKVDEAQDVLRSGGDDVDNESLWKHYLVPTAMRLAGLRIGWSDIDHRNGRLG